MKSLFLAMACLTAMTSSMADAATSVVRRTTLLVSDVKASVAFYEKIGFKVWLNTSGPRDPNGPTSLPLNVKPAQSNFTIMAGRDPWVAMVGLLQYDKPMPTRTRGIADQIGVGDAVLMIETDDVDGVYKSLQAMDTPMLQLPKETTTKSADSIKHVKNMFFRDPDGWVIEMSQVVSTEPLPTTKPDKR